MPNWMPVPPEDSAGEEEFEPYLPEPYVPDQMDGADDTGAFFDQRYGRVSSRTTRPSISYFNESGLPDDVVARHMRRGNIPTEVANVIEKWSQSLSETTKRPTVDVFNRNRWEGAHHPFAIMSQAAWAVENDDILSTTCDVIEGLMWQKCRFELYDSDQEDIWNQWAAEVNLDNTLRKVGRELFKVSQVYVGLWWEERQYAVRNDNVQDTLDEFDKLKRERDAARAKLDGLPEPKVPDGPGKGNRNRKKVFDVLVPTRITVFDPTKIFPVGNLMFGNERFAYIATDDEEKAFQRVQTGELVDRTVLQMIERKYVPTEADKQACASVGVDHNRLWLMRENTIFRHSLTRADYERFTPIRLKPALPLIEMKEHLRAADRAALIGNTNFIVLITKGSDKLPAKPAEIENLQMQAKIIARLPVLVGDHRLDVKIVAPPTDNTLIESRYQVLDSRLVFMALRSYSPVVQGGNSSGTGVSEMSRIIAKGLESRRHMVVRSLEAKVFAKIMLANEGEIDETPSLSFMPKRITLDLSADVIGQILKIRDRGDMSRETLLEEVDFDQEVEVLRRAREKALFDNVFQTSVPFSSPGANPFQPGQQPDQNGQPGQPPQAGGNVGPSGQPRTEGGRPTGATDKQPRKTAARKPAEAASDDS